VFVISKRFEFSASHVLLGLPEGHPCGRLHGHNYIVEVELTSEHLNRLGFVRDYGELVQLKRYIDDQFDHRHLNDVLAINPTAENLAATLFHFCASMWPEVSAVRVSETPKTWAEFRPSRAQEVNR
jgi:6-pyruvoyltetrahydropterin/6-carboxytetrahydropterin synthase